MNGLLKQQHSIFLTHGRPEIIEHEMEEFGINTDKFLRKNLLHIYQIPNMLENPGGLLAGYENALKTIFVDSKPPYRIVGRAIQDISTKAGMMAQLQLEHLFHNSIYSRNCTVLCHYPYNQIEPTLREKWVSNILDEHNATVFMPHHTNGISFSLPN